MCAVAAGRRDIVKWLFAVRTSNVLLLSHGQQASTDIGRHCIYW